MSMKKFLLIVVSIVALVSCNVSQSSPDGKTYGVPDEDGVRLVSNPNKVFSIDDFVKAGYKKSKQFDVTTVPGAVEVWYGFFNKKNIEVRIFESHETAMKLGKGPAEIILKKKRTGLIGSSVVSPYPAYAIVGNVVMLCERELKTCTDLIAELP